MLDVLVWAEIRRMREVEAISIREIARRTGHDRNTVRRALRRAGPPRCGPPQRRGRRGLNVPRHGCLILVGDATG